MSNLLASALSFRRSVTSAKGTAEQPEVIRALNDEKLSWFHLKVILVAGMGFFCDAYDLFVISYITKCIGRVYYPDTTYYSPEVCQSLGLSGSCGKNYALYTTAPYNFTPEQAAVQVPSAMPANITAAIQATALVGTLAGQIVFGLLGDKLGRRPMFGLSLALMIFGAIAQGLSFGSSVNGVIAPLCLFRFILGFGVGGDYPLSSTYMSEYAGRKNRGALVAAVFAMQGTGILVAATVTIIVATCFQGYPESADLLWRAVLMFGAVPAICAMYFRLTLPETPRYTLYAKNDLAGVNQDMGTVLKRELSSSTPKVSPVSRAPTLSEFMSKFGWQLFGTASTWFLLDIAFYSQNFFQSSIFTQIGWLPPAYTMDPITEAYQLARANAIIALASTIPGYWMTVLTVDRMGRIPIQLMGFAMMTVCMLILAAAYNTLISNSVGSFVFVYALAFFFANWGPNATTFIIPAELYPTTYRTTGHGISAGCGKAGSILGTFGFANAVNGIGLQGTLGIMTVVNFLGFCCTFFVPETMNKTLEEMSGDGALLPASLPSYADSNNANDDKGLGLEMATAEASATADVEIQA